MLPCVVAMPRAACCRGPVRIQLNRSVMGGKVSRNFYESRTVTGTRIDGEKWLSRDQEVAEVSRLLDGQRVVSEFQSSGITHERFLGIVICVISCEAKRALWGQNLEWVVDRLNRAGGVPTR